MVNVAIVGYKEIPSGGFPDYVSWFPQRLERFRGIHFCHVDVIGEKGNKSIAELVREMLDSKPDVLHYANYRDQHNKEKIDEQYLQEVRRQSQIPILLTSGRPEIEVLWHRLKIRTLVGVFNFNEYAALLEELASTGH